MRIRKGIILALLILVFLLLMVLRGCRGRVLPDRVVYFTDANTNEKIPSVLVIPLYGEFWGMATVEEGIWAKGGLLLANPFVYLSDGSPLVIKQPRSPGLFIMGVYIGKGMETIGVIAIAKGYKPVLIGGDSIYLGRINSRLKPLDEKEAKEQLNRISNGLRNEEFEVLLTEDTWVQDAPILEPNFSKKDLEMIEDFFEIDTKTK